MAKPVIQDDVIPQTPADKGGNAPPPVVYLSKAIYKAAVNDMAIAARHTVSGEARYAVAMLTVHKELVDNGVSIASFAELSKHAGDIKQGGKFSVKSQGEFLSKVYEVFDIEPAYAKEADTTDKRMAADTFDAQRIAIIRGIDLAYDMLCTNNGSHDLTDTSVPLAWFHEDIGKGRPKTGNAAFIVPVKKMLHREDELRGELAKAVAADPDFAVPLDNRAIYVLARDGSVPKRYATIANLKAAAADNRGEYVQTPLLNVVTKEPILDKAGNPRMVKEWKPLLTARQREQAKNNDQLDKLAADAKAAAEAKDKIERDARAAQAEGVKPTPDTSGATPSAMPLVTVTEVPPGTTLAQAHAMATGITPAVGGTVADNAIPGPKGPFLIDVVRDFHNLVHVKGEALPAWGDLDSEVIQMFNDIMMEIEASLALQANRTNDPKTAAQLTMIADLKARMNEATEAAHG